MGSKISIAEAVVITSITVASIASLTYTVNKERELRTNYSLETTKIMRQYGIKNMSTEFNSDGTINARTSN